MKRIFMVLIVLLFVIIPNFKVDALEDSFYEGEYIPDTYLKKFKGETGRYQQMKVFRRKSDNQSVYCIELWETLSSNKTITGYDQNQNQYANIDYSTWEKIMLISYYGYGYEDHTDIKWYAITQFMIWQVTSPDSNIYFTDTLNGKKITKYQDEINEINNLISNHATVPSFDKKAYMIKYKEAMTIKDVNNVLDDFDITSENLGLEINKNDNKITVKSNVMSENRVKFFKTDKKYNNNPIVYIDDNGQDVLAPGKYSPIKAVIIFRIITADLIVNKMDIDTKTTTSLGDATLVGSKFQLLDIDNQLMQEKEVDSEGNLIFENVGYGKYYLKEIRPGNGYLLNNTTYPIEINSKDNVIDIYNQVIKNKIIFNKYIKNTITNNVLLEKDAVFSIYNKDNEKIVTFATNENGYYELELPYGKYIVKQEKGLKNHYFTDDFEFNVSEDGKIQTFNLYNEELTADIKIINTDFDSDMPILESGATFKIKDLGTNKYLTDENNELLILKTSNLGDTGYLKLSCGKYEIEQLESVSGYEVNKNIFNFEISEDIEFKEDNDIKYIEIIIPNQKQKSQIEIEKYIEYYLNDNLQKKEKDNDISIPIYAKEDIYSKDGLKIYDKDEQVSKAELEDNIVITDFLMLGDYYIKSPIDNTLVEISLDKIENKKIELLEKIYEYEEVEPMQEEIKIDVIENQENSDKNEIIIEIPNTLSKQSIISKIDILLILIGLYIIKKEKQNEKN